ncbi:MULTISPECIES: type II secretion system F family protein [Marinobacter]|uniref:Type II secretion system protein n=1 Tax=Marinobacter nauticus (strain ATCC 700491 / DSM 11845 / VT8) TaxID=351348 RepID=A1U403_MARN8|nr:MULTISPECIES: type II secretion system F family protein [Marinobacter]ABM19722.1 type II secretion system protein [Marinobacter nauticus VT8]
MNFKYQSIDAQGRTLEGDVEAESRKQALGKLKQQGLRVTSLSEAAGKPGAKRPKGKISREELLLALSELATLLRSGVSLKDAIDSLTGGERAAAMQSVFDRWSSGLRQGESFSDALRASGVPVPEYLFQLVKAGELTGEMGDSLQTAVSQMEYEKQIATEMKNALVYPAILCFSGVGAVLLVFTFVVPQFQNLLEHGDKLPWLAWAVLATGKWVNANMAWVIGAALAAIIVMARVFSLPAVRSRFMDGLQSVPVVGDWIVEAETARWASILAALVNHRVAILDALELARNTVRLPSRQSRLSRVSGQVKSGVPLSSALKENSVITNTGYNLLRAGEKSGEVARLLKSLAELHDTSGRNRMKRFLALIEPIAILLIGGVIGVIIMGVILAITSANDIAF